MTEPTAVVHRLDIGDRCQGCNEPWPCAAEWERTHQKLVDDGPPPNRSRKRSPKDGT